MSALLGLICLLQVSVGLDAKLYASDGWFGDEFGASVDLCGDTLAVGAPRHASFSGARLGAVYVLDRTTSGWTERAQLVPSNGALFPSNAIRFGSSIALSPPRIAVGAESNYLKQAYVYVDSGGAWSEEAIIEMADPAPSGQFGYSIALDGDTLVVGAPVGPSVYSIGPHTGAAYVYVRSGGAWTKLTKLTASEATERSKPDSFGVAVAIEGDTICVGAADGDGASSGDGCVHVFRRNAGVWTPETKLYAPLGRTGDRFGFSLSLDGERLVVGAPYAEVRGYGEAGCAYVFEDVGGTWNLAAHLWSHSYTWSMRAGLSVALLGETTVVGEPTSLFQPGSGYASLFVLAGSQWGEQIEFTPPDGLVGDSTTHALALDGERLVLGSRWNDGLYTNAGAVYVYDLRARATEPAWYCQARLDDAGCRPRIFHFGLPSVSAAMAGEPWVIHAWDVQKKVLGCLVYSTLGPASTPFGGGTLCVMSPYRRTPLQSAQQWVQDPCPGRFKFDFGKLIKSGTELV